MKKFTLALATLFTIGALSVNAQTKWTLDKAHSIVKFSVTHMVV